MPQTDIRRIFYGKFLEYLKILCLMLHSFNTRNISTLYVILIKNNTDSTKIMDGSYSILQFTRKNDIEYTTK